MIRAIRLTATDMPEANTLLTIDDERCRPGNIESGNAEAMIDPVALDHRAVGVDEERDREPMGCAVFCHFRRTLADDHHYLGPHGLVR
jgi:hypothetical protein